MLGPYHVPGPSHSCCWPCAGTAAQPGPAHAQDDQAALTRHGAPNASRTWCQLSLSRVQLTELPPVCQALPLARPSPWLSVSSFSLRAPWRPAAVSCGCLNRQTNLLAHSSEAQESKMGLPGLTLRCWPFCLPLSLIGTLVIN